MMSKMTPVQLLVIFDVFTCEYSLRRSTFSFRFAIAVKFSSFSGRAATSSLTGALCAGCRAAAVLFMEWPLP